MPPFQTPATTPLLGCSMSPRPPAADTNFNAFPLKAIASSQQQEKDSAASGEFCVSITILDSFPLETDYGRPTMSQPLLLLRPLCWN
ncbi:hypothetical protein PAXRUDRAFT_828741 [Paxillus rubicundulus Ve08.2h10]|uniref:Uncharacterized protein n=1 Tax=Paxillus rubicundulus Ve08.2h10 TaxID=930991 RepID=A0A0D0E0X8_9AGAM|nr:hypothetical protein PAXRUDRAFT_828741 [Paxillus rubicundulus Ve08.2h10]